MTKFNENVILFCGQVFIDNNSDNNPVRACKLITKFFEIREAKKYICKIRLVIN